LAALGGFFGGKLALGPRVLRSRQDSWKRSEGSDVDQRSGLPVDLNALSKLAPELAETFVTLASDIALVIDSHGVIHKVAQGAGGALAPGAKEWVGRAWADTVTGETRIKAEELLREAGAAGVSCRREINHPSPSGIDIPVSYAAVRLGVDGPVLAVGRDLRAVAGIQQQFVEAQQEIEREYWKHREAESRYRLLFEVATDAVLVVDAESLRIVDANQAASALFDVALDRLIGMEVLSTMDRASRPATGELLSTARAAGLSGEMRAWLAGRKLSVRISATPFRSVEGMMLLVRVRAAGSAADAADAETTLVKLVHCTPDAVVVTDAGGRILMANPAFLELAGFADESHAKGQHLADFIEPELTELLSSARNRGIAKGRTLTMRGQHGRQSPIEVSAALLAEEEQECVGLTIRVLGPETAPRSLHQRGAAELAAAIDALTMQLGCLGLTELLRRVEEQAERHFVQAAMRAARLDRAKAAEILGLTADQLDARLCDEPAPSDKSAKSNRKPLA